jgi:hypothetical protein
MEKFVHNIFIPNCPTGYNFYTLFYYVGTKLYYFCRPHVVIVLFSHFIQHIPRAITKWHEIAFLNKRTLL